MTYGFAWERGDPLKVLMRKGQDCTHCIHLSEEPVFEHVITVCKKNRPVGKRCQEWKHKGQERT